MYDYKEDLRKLVEETKRKERIRIIAIIKSYEVDYDELIEEINND